MKLSFEDARIIVNEPSDVDENIDEIYEKYTLNLGSYSLEFTASEILKNCSPGDYELIVEELQDNYATYECPHCSTIYDEQDGADDCLRDCLSDWIYDEVMKSLEVIGAGYTDCKEYALCTVVVKYNIEDEDEKTFQTSPIIYTGEKLSDELLIEAIKDDPDFQDSIDEFVEALADELIKKAN